MNTQSTEPTQPQDDDALRQGEVRGMNKTLWYSISGAAAVLAIAVAVYATA